MSYLKVRVMRFSLALEGNKPLHEYAKYLKLAEKYGFYSFQLYEHLTFRPAWATAFHIAKHTEEIFLGPVTVPVMLCHPAYTAANIAALSEATGGKAVLGISRGAFYEYLSERIQKPITAVKEAIEIIDLLLKGGGRYDGIVFRLSEDARIKFRISHNDIEMYVGSSGPKMIQMASGLKPVRAILVDNLWNPQYVQKIRESIQRGASVAGRSVEEISIIARPFCCVMKNRQDAVRIMTKQLAAYLPSLVADSPMLMEAGVDFEDLLKFSSHPEGDEDLKNKIIMNFSATGTEEDIIEQTHRMLKAGVRHVCYGHPLGEDLIHSIKIIGEKVIPYFGND